MFIGISRIDRDGENPCYNQSSGITCIRHVEYEMDTEFQVGSFNFQPQNVP